MPESGARSAPDETLAADLHTALIDNLLRAGAIRTPAVEAAFRAILRHHFLPGVPVERVYRDAAIPTHEADGVPISSSSQPAAMAIMLEQLDLRPGQRVLEIGAGTGYNAALLARLVGPNGRVVTVDLDEPIVAEARANLARAGVVGVEVVRGDGADGYPANAPYDRIVLTVGAWDVAPAWTAQLAAGGRLLLPLWLRGAQFTAAFERATDDAGQEHLASVNLSGCAFMRLRGGFAGPEAYLALDGGLTLGVDDRSRVNPANISRLLDGPAWDVPLPPNDLGAFGLWLALREPDRCDISAGETAPHPLARRLPVVASEHRFAHGLLSDAAICVRVPAVADGTTPPDDGEPPAILRCFSGERAPADLLVNRYLDHLAAWDAAGRPTSEGLRLRVYPRDPAPSLSADAIVAKRVSTVAIDWA